MASAKRRSPKEWQEMIRNGQRFQQKFGNSKSWADWKQYYRHEFKSEGTLPVNQMFSIMRSVVAQTYLRNPSVTVTPRKPGLKYYLHAKILESVDRWLIRELMVKGQIKKMIGDTFLTGLASGFHGYDSEYGWDPQKAVEGAPASLTQFDRKSGYRIEYNSFIKPGMPWFLRARPEDVVFPWGTTDPYNAPWVALRCLRPLGDMKKDSKYKIPSDIKGTHIPLRRGPEDAVQAEGPLDNQQSVQEWLEFWQVHSAETGKIYAIAMDTGEFLRSDRDYMQIEGLPVLTLCFNDDPDYIYGVPDAKIIEPQLLELNEIRTQAMKHRRVDLLKILYRKGAISKDAIEKLMDEKVKGGVEVEAETDDIRRAVMPFTSNIAGVLQDMAFSAELARQDIRETVGFPRTQMGEFQGKTHVSAEEVQQVMSRSDIRIDERRDAVADLLEGIIRRFNQTIFTYWTTPQIQQIVGPDGFQYWLEYTGPEIKAEFDYRIDPYSATPKTPEVQKKEAIEMANAWAQMNSGQIKQGVPIPAEIQRYFFRNYEGINVEKLLSQQGLRAPSQGVQNTPMNTDEATRYMMQRGGQR